MTAEGFPAGTAGERPSRPRQLFNGRDLTGWGMTGRGGFVVEGGALKGQGGMGLLWYTESKFGDALLRVVYRVSRVEDNSGVFVRIAEGPPDQIETPRVLCGLCCM